MSNAIAKALLAILQAEGIHPSHVCADSRLVRSGDIFLAYPGHQSDGRRHIADAIAHGAAAVLWEREGYEWDVTNSVPNLPVDGLRSLAGDIADEVLDHPSEHL